MKSIVTIILALGFGQFTFAQTGKITYDVTQKLQIMFGGGEDEPALPEGMADMFPEEQTYSKELLFNNGISLYRDKKGEEAGDLNLESDDGSIQIKIARDEVNDILFVDHMNKEKVHQTGIMGKPFIIKDDLDKLSWKITNEKVKYLDYECTKAVYEEEDKLIVAWFTPQIAPFIGPGKYHSLPGTILLLNINDGETEFKAREVVLEDVSSEIKKPKKGKKVSQKEFDEIKAQKEKEMQEQMGNMTKRIEIGHE